jgi:hypothetical protein
MSILLYIILPLLQFISFCVPPQPIIKDVFFARTPFLIKNPLHFTYILVQRHRLINHKEI